MHAFSIVRGVRLSVCRCVCVSIVSVEAEHRGLLFNQLFHMGEDPLLRRVVSQHK